MSKLTLAALIMLIGTQVMADPSFFVVKGDKMEPIRKVDALKLLITSDNKTEVVKCTPVKVDEDKGTLRNR